MPLYALICNDRPDAGTTRADTRPAHLEFLKGLGSRLKLAGPFLDGNDRPNGSLVVLEAESESDAKAVAGEDPYAKAGLFAEVTVRAWNWTVNKPEN